MSTYLKRQCLFDVPIGALSEPESYEENIYWRSDYDRSYGIMCLTMSPKIHHLIDFVEYPFEIWKKLDKAFGMQKEEDETWRKPTLLHNER